VVCANQHKLAQLDCWLKPEFTSEPITHAAARLTGIGDEKQGHCFSLPFLGGLITRIGSTPAAKTDLPEEAHG
jgi:hypothetical protein